MKEFFALMEMFYTLIWMVVHKCIHLSKLKLYTWNEYILCKLYFNNVDFKEKNQIIFQVNRGQQLGIITITFIECHPFWTLFYLFPLISCIGNLLFCSCIHFHLPKPLTKKLLGLPNYCGKDCRLGKTSLEP